MKSAKQTLKDIALSDLHFDDEQAYENSSLKNYEDIIEKAMHEYRAKDVSGNVAVQTFLRAYQISNGNEVIAFLAAIRRRLSTEQLVTLRDALIYMTPAIEISDEKIIEKAVLFSKKYRDNKTSSAAYQGFKNGARWHGGQIKLKTK